MNGVLTRHAGFYPNEAHPVDRGLYLFLFMAGDRALASIAYHACHPMTRCEARRASPDYIQAIREEAGNPTGADHARTNNRDLMHHSGVSHFRPRIGQSPLLHRWREDALVCSI